MDGFGAGSLFVFYHHTSVILGIFSLLHPVLSIYHPVLAVQVLEFHAHHFTQYIHLSYPILPTYYSSDLSALTISLWVLFYVFVRDISHCGKLYKVNMEKVHEFSLNTAM